MTTKSNFERLVQQPMPARTIETNGPNGYGAGRVDGRSLRRTGRTVQFATVVTEDFKRWIKAEAVARRKTQAAVLDDMRAAYSEKQGG